MNSKMTLTNFIDGIIADYKLPSTDRMKANIRKKFTETIKNNYHFKSKNVWENAEKIKVAKTYSRVFDSNTLNELLKISQDYLVSLSNKQSSLTNKQLQKAQKEMERKLWEEDNNVINYDEDDQLQIQDTVEKYCKNLKKDAVIDALFRKFYTPLKISKIKEDQSTLYYSASPTEKDYILANNRLRHPENIYYKKRK